MQIPGFFECYNGVFGIENQLMYLLLYTEEMEELYRRQAEWNIRVADHCIDLGVDMVHISYDWGAQKDLLFSPELWWRLIYPNMKKVVDHCHSRGVFVSLHSDGCVAKVADGIAQLGFDLIHPWQESAGMTDEQLIGTLAEMGYRHLVYTDIARDGMQTGIDEQAYVQMAAAFGHPVIASGGVAGMDDIVRLAEAEAASPGSIEGVIAGRAIYEGGLLVEEALAACAE